jgi:hypothetical protein
MSSLEWDCPKNLKSGEIIEIDDSYAGIIECVVEDTVDNVISVSYESVPLSIDPKYTKWRRKPGVEVYGARCTGKYCGEYFEHALAVPNKSFLCWSCRNR